MLPFLVSLHMSFCGKTVLAQVTGKFFALVDRQFMAFDVSGTSKCLPTERARSNHPQ